MKEGEKTMGQYSELASNVIENVGGKENIASLTHCFTRLRFKLHDESIANDEVLKQMDGVVTIMKSMGQYMVVIGEHVPLVYDEVLLQLGMQKQDMVETPSEKEEKQSVLRRVMAVVMAGMSPLLNLLCACGIIKGALVIGTLFGLSTQDGIYQLLNAAGDSVFYFLPLVLGYNVASHMKMDPILGLIIGAALCYPTINGTDLVLFGNSINVSYTGTFLPIMIAISVAAPLYKVLMKAMPNVIRGFCAPLLTLIIIFPLTFVVIGPVANLIGTWISVAMNTMIEAVPIIAAPLFAGVWQILVIFGVHNIPGMLALMDVSAGNPSAPMVIMILPAFAQIGVVLAVYFKTKDKKLKSIALPAFASGVFGITEPAIYGVTLPRMKMFIISCIGAAASGLFIAIFNMKTYTFSGMGIVGLLGLLNPESPNILPIILAPATGFIVAFILASLFYKDTETNEMIKATQIKEIEQKDVTILSPVKGRVEAIAKCSDEAFAMEGLGKGVVIYPETGEVIAPCDGIVKILFPTLHAIGIESENGCEILIHIGINTVELEGKYFTPFIKQGDKVKAGQLLMRFDIHAIEKEGYCTEIPVVITNTNKFKDIVVMEEGTISQKQPLLTAIVKKEVK